VTENAARRLNPARKIFMTLLVMGSLGVLFVVSVLRVLGVWLWPVSPSGWGEPAGRHAVTVGEVRAMGGGRTATYLIGEGGRVWAWGDNSSRQLGTGVPACRPVPVEVLFLDGVVAITAQGDRVYALRSDGTVWTWGAPASLGGGTATPAQITSLTDVVSLAAGSGSGFALRRDGTVWTWGHLDQAGSQPVPAPVDGLDQVTAIAARRSDGYALRADGTVWTLTEGASGDAPGAIVATEVTGLPRIKAVAAGDTAGYAIAEDGSIWGWGVNPRCLPPATAPGRPQASVQLPDVTGATAIVAGPGDAYVLAEGGQLWAWGENSCGQLGDGTEVWSSADPIRVPVSGPVVAAAAAAHNAYAVTEDGRVWAWGLNLSGELGDAAFPAHRHVHSPVEVRGLPRAVAVAAGHGSGYALAADGKVWAWGDDSFGQLGVASLLWSREPEEVAGLSGAVAVAGLYDAALALKDDGTVWTWGRSLAGQSNSLDLPATALVLPSPVRVPFLSGVTAIGAGQHTAYALLGDGSVVAWGSNQWGGLGSGEQTASGGPDYGPVKVAGLPAIRDIAASGASACALAADGTIWVWGRLDLDTGASLPHASGAAPPAEVVWRPKLVPAPDGVTAVAASTDAFFALDRSGGVWAWGSSRWGELGQGCVSGEVVAEPQRVGGLPEMVAIAASERAACSLDRKGLVWFWGTNDWVWGPGAEGVTVRATPEVVAGLNRVVSLWAFGDRVFALRRDGSLWAWGQNRWGVLGDGTTLSTQAPVRVLIG